MLHRVAVVTAIAQRAARRWQSHGHDSTTRHCSTIHVRWLVCLPVCPACRTNSKQQQSKHVRRAKLWFLESAQCPTLNANRQQTHDTLATNSRAPEGPSSDESDSRTYATGLLELGTGSRVARLTSHVVLRGLPHRACRVRVPVCVWNWNCVLCAWNWNDRCMAHSDRKPDRDYPDRASCI